MSVDLPTGARLDHTPAHTRTIEVPEAWTLQLPDGTRIDLIGNRGEKQRDEMIRTILESRGLR